MYRSILSTQYFSTRFGAIAILVLVLALGVTAFDFAPQHPLATIAVQIRPACNILPSQSSAPVEQQISMGSGYWLVTNPETGQFIRAEMRTNRPMQTPAEQKVYVSGGYWLVTNPEDGHFIRVELDPRQAVC